MANQAQSTARAGDAPTGSHEKAIRPAEAPAIEKKETRFGTPESWAVAGNVAICGIFFILAVAALKLGRSIILPVTAAMILAIALRPLQTLAARYRIPSGVSAFAILLAFCALLLAAVTLLSGPVSEWVENAPQIGEKLKPKLQLFDRPLAAFRELQAAIGGGSTSGPAVTVETGFATIAQQALSILTPAATEFIVFFGTLVFFLAGTDRLRRYLITTFQTRDARLRTMRIWNDIEKNLVTYVGAVTVVNIGLGVVTAAMLYLVDFPNPIAFGVLIFVLNYVPYLGPAIFSAVLALVGLITMPTLGGALIAPALFIAIATVEGHFITPSFVGKRLTLSPFLVFLAVAFWTWLWGPFGTFLATPLLIVSFVVLQHVFSDDDETSLP